MRIRRVAGIVAVAVCAVALGAEDARPMKVAAPPAQREAYPGPPGMARPVLPGPVVAARPAVVGQSIKEPLAAERLPALAAGRNDVPSRPMFAEAGRLTVGPSAVLAPRVPSLLGTPKRSMRGGGGGGASALEPAAPVVTRPVVGVDGGSVMTTLPPLTREILVEAAPVAGALAVGAEPYLQAVGAPDDQDAPAVGLGTPARPRLE